MSRNGSFAVQRFEKQEACACCRSGGAVRIRRRHRRAGQVHPASAGWARVLRFKGYEDWQVVSVSQTDDASP